MGKIQIQTNRVTLCGEISGDSIYNYLYHGKNYFLIKMNVFRKNKVLDELPVLIPGHVLRNIALRPGMKLLVMGQYRSYNIEEKLILMVYAMKCRPCGEAESKKNCSNRIYLEGYLCRKPIYRTTPLGREIADLLVAVNRLNGRSDYIPCICWGSLARWARHQEVGCHLTMEGRIQSRIYFKKMPDGCMQQKTAYEISIFKIHML